ncbi:hypothetical protein EAH89_24025 [Roseomonas nepalensis]|uniref:Uncharacterized protein n=1 Tax=Muricoccus nepalensis TaxID=1854500 RepID=A0A502FCN0_9PROT|nr:hypothetical protein [Roseomonas nepalensis]TPG47059.1 hypothetical protein EAH89_24025 [Roseomonas nepalensis]
MSDGLAGAIGKLEAAVERLAAAAQEVARERDARLRAEAEPAGVPPAEVAALSARLEATIARLRAALPDGAEVVELDDLGLAEEEPEEAAPGGRGAEGGDAGHGALAGAPRGAGEG